MSESLSPDGEQIKKAIAALHAPSSVIELRAIHKGGRKRVDAGYFDGEHRDLLVAEAIKRNNSGAAVYVTMNEVDPQLLSRHANRIEEYAQATATDNNVIRRQWLLIDIDPQRPKDTSATHEQLALVLERAGEIYEYLAQRGWPKPTSADSGNGLHFLYRVDLPNDEPSRDLIKHCLEALAARFDNDAVKVDRSVFNAARIIKLHGTIANKGDNVPAAPWRLSKLRTVPDEVQTVSIELLQALAAEIAAAKTHTATTVGNGHSWTEGDVQAFLIRGGIEATGPDSHEGAYRWKLKSCPFNPDHGYGEAAVFLRPDGRLGFECRHNSCQDKHWKDLRTLIDGARDTRGRLNSGTRSSRAPSVVVQAEQEPMAGLVCAAAITPEPINWLWDGWLAAGKLHILAGAPGTGKTTVALAFAATISCGGRWPDGARAQPGHVLIWSAEDDAKDTLVPRLITMGADLNQVHFIQTANDGDRRRSFDPATDICQLHATIRQLGISPNLLIVDPIVSAVAGDSHKGSETRRSLQPLVDLGASECCGVLGISHFSKGTAGRDVIERVTGSLAFGALARLVYAAAKMPDDQGGGRFIARAKSNLGPDGGGYRYELQQRELPDHPGISASTLLWGDAIEGNARDILAQAEVSEDVDTKSQTDEAQDWLADLLRDAPVKATDAIKKAGAAGISPKSLRAARERLSVKPKKQAYTGGWVWSLPHAQDARCSQDAQDAQTQGLGTLGTFDDRGHLGKVNGTHDEEVF